LWTSRQQGLDVLTMQGVTEGPLVSFWGKAMLGMNDEPHVRLRKLVQAAFTPRHVEALRPQVREVINELLADLRDRDQVDFMAAFADHFPARIIGAMLGVPPDDTDRLARWTEALGLMFTFPVNPYIPAIDAAVSEMGEFVDGLIAARRAAPAADMISAFLAVEVDGDRLTDLEVRNLVMMPALGGHDTTRCQLGSAIALFVDHPDQWALLGDQPELGATAAEEVMRLLPTVPMVFRVTREQFHYQDLDVPGGTFIGMCAALAQTDPREYGEAPFDITARRSPPLTFGGGALEVTVQGAKPTRHRVGSGTVIGEVAFFDGQPRSADIVAVGDVELLVLSYAGFERVAAADPALAQLLLLDLGRFLAQRLRASEAS
jgi:cytochrome P450